MVKLNIDYAALDRFERGPEVTRALKKGADAGRDAAKRRVEANSYETGDLDRGIESESAPGAARYGTNVRHGEFVELGTFRMSAEPFIRPAIDDVRRALS